jgi:hypothetical protein
MLNLDQILSAARWIVTTVGTYYATKGVITADQVQLIGGAVAALISLAWSFYVHASSDSSARAAGGGSRK